MDGPIVRHCYRDSAMKMGATELAAKATAVTRNSVETERDSVSAEHVVLATGHWSGGMGLDLPVLPEKHQLYFASVGEIDPKWPFVIDADTTYHFRPHGDQIIICYNDEELASEIHGVDENPEFDYKVLDRLLPIVEHRTPGLIERESIELGRAGYYGVTPDHHPILGRKDGVIVATGFGGHGVMHSPAAGKLVTEMVLDGEANSVDVACLSPNRFQTGQLIQETMVF
jgi:sarcosine oxidase subunit beta